MVSSIQLVFQLLHAVAVNYIHRERIPKVADLIQQEITAKIAKEPLHFEFEGMPV